MSGVNLAVLGATGVVGNEILKILADSSIPINSLNGGNLAIYIYYI